MVLNLIYRTVNLVHKRVSFQLGSILLCGMMAFWARAESPHMSFDELVRMKSGAVIVESSGDRHSSSQRISAKGFFQAEVGEIREVLLDFGHYAEFMPGFRESSLLEEGDIPVLGDADSLRQMTGYFEKVQCERDSSGICFWYQRMDFPWPVPDRCSILKVEYSDSEITSKQVVGMFKALSGGWKLIQVEGGVVALYHAEADPDIGIPGFVQRIGMDIMLPEVYRAIGKRIEANRKGPQ